MFNLRLLEINYHIDSELALLAETIQCCLYEILFAQFQKLNADQLYKTLNSKIGISILNYTSIQLCKLLCKLHSIIKETILLSLFLRKYYYLPTTIITTSGGEEFLIYLQQST